MIDMVGWKVLSKEEVKDLINYLYENFGIDKKISKKYVYFKYRNGIFLLTSSIDILAKVNPRRVGIKVFKIRGGSLEPTNAIPHIFKSLIKRNVVVLSKGELRELINKGFMRKSLNLPDHTYVVIKYSGIPIGIARYRYSTLICNLSYLANTVF